MDLLTRFPWGPLVFSTVLGSVAGIAILAFGVPPKVFALVAWGTIALYAALSSWAERRLGRR